jgi:hypothetical protein
VDYHVISFSRGISFINILNSRMSAISKSDLWQFGPQSLLALTAGYSVIEPISYYLIPAISKSSTVKEYYNHKKIPFPIVASGDYLYSVILFIVAQQVIGTIFGGAKTVTIVDWLIRFLIFCVVQWVGDFSWYKLITNISPSTKYIDFFQRYTKQVGAGALIGDSLYGLGWFSVSQLIASYVPVWLQVVLVVSFIFGTIVVSY